MWRGHGGEGMLGQLIGLGCWPRQPGTKVDGGFLYRKGYFELYHLVGGFKKRHDKGGGRSGTGTQRRCPWR